jgi:hypothetical protein
MTKNMMVKKLYEWKSVCTRLAGRPKSRRENDIKGDLRIMKINNWTTCVQEGQAFQNIML